MAADRAIVAVRGHRPGYAERLGLDAAEARCVARSALFSGLEPEALDLLLEEARVRPLVRGQLLFLQGDPAEHVYVVLSGWIRLSRMGADGSQLTIHILGPGESFAEAAVFRMGTYPVSAEAVDRSRLLEVPAAVLLGCLRERVDLCFNMMASMAARLHRFVEQLEQLATRSAVERVALFLCRLAGERSGSCTLRLPLDKTLIAARLGMQPETFSRALAKLRRYGVATRGGTVTIEDLERLRAVARFGED